jgi:hypothetical protein
MEVLNYHLQPKTFVVMFIQRHLADRCEYSNADSHAGVSRLDSYKWIQASPRGWRITACRLFAIVFCSQPRQWRPSPAATSTPLGIRRLKDKNCRSLNSSVRNPSKLKKKVLKIRFTPYCPSFRIRYSFCHICPWGNVRTCQTMRRLMPSIRH